jgi:hypothetical protein
LLCHKALVFRPLLLEANHVAHLDSEHRRRLNK